MSGHRLSDEDVAALVRDAAAAPSMHNAQPWRFRYHRHEHTIEVCADLGRAMPHADPDTRALHLGCGAALLNLRVALAHRGWGTDTLLLPDPTDRTLLATVRPTGRDDGTSGLAALYPAIPRRHTNRYPFEERDIPADVRTALAAAARAEGVTLAFPSPWHLQEVLELAREAEARNLTDRGSDEDLARWTRGGPSETVGDGVPSYAFGPRLRGGKAPMRDFAGTRRTPGRAAKDFERNPHLALLSTPRDSPEDWLRAGQAMERVLLLATLEGLSSSFATQPLEWTDLRWPLRDPVTGRGFPQMVLRLGYGPPVPGTPRRPVPEIVEILP
ncbi:Acg family FMN-binding oxidoreductase [Streptomyces sp. NPDC058735]|uniref:Acg family FMN-binding oxidoreductase n=1 Tax=unclassified Streptomyces TaxID=2593676 RepID=UPI00368F0664